MSVPEPSPVAVPGVSSPPGDLQERGAAFWLTTLEEFELTEAELVLLLECCRLLDETEALAAAIRVEGYTVEGSAGQPRAHPALAELRQARLALGRLLPQLDLSDEDGRTMPTPTTTKARRAAETRWRTCRGGP